MGAEQLAGVMEIIKVNSALKANKKIDKRKLNRDKKILIADSEKKGINLAYNIQRNGWLSNWPKKNKGISKIMSWDYLQRRYKGKWFIWYF